MTHPDSFSIPLAGTARRISPRARRRLPQTSSETISTMTNFTRSRPCLAPRTHSGQSTDGDATSSSAVGAPLVSWIPSKMRTRPCRCCPCRTIKTEVAFVAHSPTILIAMAVNMTLCSCGYIHDRSCFIFYNIGFVSGGSVALLLSKLFESNTYLG